MGTISSTSKLQNIRMPFIFKNYEIEGADFIYFYLGVVLKNPRTIRRICQLNSKILNLSIKIAYIIIFLHQ